MTGYFGKVPFHADFVERNLDPRFVTSWDSWLQRGMADSKSQLGDSWLDIYLTAPIWHFALPEGLVSESKWLGMVLPSVDKVGRYFPLTLACPVHETGIGLGELLLGAEHWAEDMETLGYDILDQGLSADDIELRLQQLAPPASPACSFWEPARGGLAVSGADIALPQALALLGDRAGAGMEPGATTYWYTRGGEHTAPILFRSEGLPGAEQFVSMLRGYWPGRAPVVESDDDW